MSTHLHGRTRRSPSARPPSSPRAIRARRGDARARSSRRTSRACDARSRGSTRSSPSASTRRARRPTPPTRGSPRRRGDELPPLLGVPCTIKESIAVAGMPNARRRSIAPPRPPRRADGAGRRSALLDAGAIPLGVTNTSELTMWIESENRVYGRTTNAYDRTRTAGGSSGGEGAAVGCGRVADRARHPTSAARSACRPSSTASSATSRSPGLVPDTGQFPAADGEATRHARRRPAGPPRRGPDAAAAARSPVPTAIDPAPARSSSATRPTVELEGLDGRARRGRVAAAGRAASCATRASARRARSPPPGAARARESLRSMRGALELLPRGAARGRRTSDVRELLEQEAERTAR